MNNFAVIGIALAVAAGAGFLAYEWNCMKQADAQATDPCCDTNPAESDVGQKTLRDDASPIPEPVAAACTIAEAETLKDRAAVTEQLFSSAVETKVTDSGYAFAFSRAQAHDLFDYANFESDCCGFLQFTITFETNSGPVWLTVETAPENRSVLDAMLDKFQKTGE